MNIESLKRQHLEIRQLIDEIESYLSQDVLAQAFHISLKIGTLAGKVSIHLKSEDDYLYPSLMASSNESLKETAKRFDQEMGHTAQLFSEYKAKYMSSTRIKQDLTQFIADTKLIISTLRVRLSNEDNKLYPLLQKM